VVEDNLMAASSLEMFLTRAGHTVAVAHSGDEGLEEAKRFLPEVVLCDIGLPGMDGYEVARTLRNEPRLRNAQLIAVTGYAQRKDRERAQAAGFDLHLAKPVDLDELDRVLADFDLAPPA
jgi:CheY-like chemotaxis protein